MLTRTRVAVLCSQRAPGLAHLLAESRQAGASFDVVCCLTSADNLIDAPLLLSYDVPLITHPVRAFYAAHTPGCRFSDREARIAYDRRTAAMLNAFRPDVIVLAGYLLLLTHPMVTAYAGRIINVHHSDLLRRNAAGAARYPGLRAVRDAILAGELETRSSAHLVTERLDEGPLLARSEPYPVPVVAQWAREAGDKDVLKSAIWAHQEWMLRTAFGPLMVRAIEMVAAAAPFRECA